MKLLVKARLFSLSAVSLAALVFAGLSVSNPRPAFALTNCTVSDNSFDSEEQAFLTRINQYRQQNGLGALTASTNLNRAASWLANDMATKNYMSHTDSLGRGLGPRLQQCDTQYGSAAENIAAGYTSAASVFEGWRTSSGHNTNMLGASFRQIGIARVYSASSTYGWYWATDFSSVDDGTRAGGTGGGGGGSATPTPSPTPSATAVANRKASMTSPAAGSTLAGASVTFAWGGASSNAREYFLYAGTTGAGSSNLHAASAGTATSKAVTNLPTNGSTVYVRLWTRFDAGWQYNDYTYKAATASGGGSTPSAKAVMNSPVPGSRLTAASQTFGWSAGSGAQEYFLYVGSTGVGSGNLYARSAGTSLSAAVSNLPTNGSTLYVRLWTRNSAGWQYNDYTYRAK